MSRKVLHVIIAGEMKSGKTTLAEFLKKKLAEVGIDNVDIIDDSSLPPRAELEWRMKQLQLTKTEVRIVTRHLAAHDEHVEVALDREESA